MDNDELIRGWKDAEAAHRPASPAGELTVAAYGGLAPSTEHASTLGCCGGYTNESTCGVCPTDIFC